MNADRFKFRAWDKRHNEMECGFNIDCDGIMRDCFLGDGCCPVDQDDYILMQSTGLKDKNGKLIFEGDIVDAQQAHTMKIVFEGAAFGFCPIGDHENYNVWPMGQMYPGAQMTKYCEVLGNIHENPELIKCQKS